MRTGQNDGCQGTRSGLGVQDVENSSSPIDSDPSYDPPVSRPGLTGA